MYLMQLKYKYFFGGDWNPYEKEAEVALKHLVEERSIKDPKKEKPNREILPKLDSWPDYVLAASKSAFWQGERDVCHNEAQKTVEIEDLWRDATETRSIGGFIKDVEADEVEKAMCYYLASLFHRFDPDNYVVDFRLYFTESTIAYYDNDSLSSLTPYLG